MQKKRNVARQSTSGKLIGRQGEVHCNSKSTKKGDMTVVVKDGASIETQRRMQSTAVKNHGEKKRFLFEFSI